MLDLSKTTWIHIQDANLWIYKHTTVMFYKYCKHAQALNCSNKKHTKSLYQITHHRLFSLMQTFTCMYIFIYQLRYNSYEAFFINAWKHFYWHTVFCFNSKRLNQMNNYVWISILSSSLHNFLLKILLLKIFLRTVLSVESQ